MKITLLTLASFILFSFLFVSTAKSESLEIYEQELVDNGSIDKPIKFYAGVKNLTDEQISIEIEVDPVSLVQGHEIECCAGIMCYPPKTEKFILMGLPPIAANASTDEHFLEGKLLHNGIEGKSIIDYKFYVIGNMEDKVTVSVEYNVGTVSVNELNDFTYYLSKPFPNPSTDVFFISYGLPVIAVDAKFELYDVNGSIVKSIDLQSGNGTISVNTNTIPSGKYFYRVLSNEQILENNSIIIGH